ncbi:MAG: cysteine desulfurase family protein [Myxococcota bacterium]
MFVYLDHNATTPPRPEALDAVRRAAEEHWANPASVHRPGQRARAQLEQARRAVAALVGMHRRDVVLTAGGTEANNLALWHAFAGREGECGLVVSNVEHPSVTNTATQLARAGVPVAWARANRGGVVTPEAVREAATSLDVPVGLISVQAVNSETGIIQPLNAIAEVAREVGAPLHADTVQAVGRLERDRWGDIDLAIVAAHKIRGPKGIGALVTRPGVKLHPVLRGGEQERGIRPGTQDAGLAAGLSVAARAAVDGPSRYRALARLRDQLERAWRHIGAQAGREVSVNGDVERRMPHVSNLSVEGWRAPELCAALDLEGIAISSGSACSAGTAEPSAVVEAMVGRARAEEAVRISLGETTTEEEIERAIDGFRRVLHRG